MQSTGSTVASNSPRPDQARSKAPVFVLGCPRSGTTLLYHMLLSAGNFAIYRGESQVFNLLEPRFGDLKVLRNRRKLLAAWEGSALFTRTGLDAGQVEAEVMDNCLNAGDFLRIVMDAMARKQGVERWADCTPEHLLFLQRIKETIPDALIVHIIRDGRDVALSLGKQRWIRPFRWNRGSDLLVAALYWEWIVKRGREDGEKLGADYYEVRYEDLVADPTKTLAQLGTFLEQDLDYARITQVGIGSVSEPNSSFRNEAEPGEFHPVARWKAALSRDQLIDMECLVGETLSELGYPPVTTELTRPNRTALMRMRTSYRAYFDSKRMLKTKTLLGRIFGTRDLSWV